MADAPVVPHHPGARTGPDTDSGLVVGSFTPSVVLEVARTTGRLEAAGLAVREVPVASSPGQFRSLLDGEIDVDAFLSHRLSLDEVNRGFDLMHDQDGIRSVIAFS